MAASAFFLAPHQVIVSVVSGQIPHYFRLAQASVLRFLQQAASPFIVLLLYTLTQLSITSWQSGMPSGSDIATQCHNLQAQSVSLMIHMMSINEGADCMHLSGYN